jgi:serine protease AprX
MNAQNSFQRVFRQRIFTSLVVFSLLFVPFAGKPQTPDRSMLPVIVQAVDANTASLAVQHLGGTVTRGLNIINSVAADVTAYQVGLLQLSPDVTSVWPDIGVKSAETADPGVNFPPSRGYEKSGAAFSLAKVLKIDGKYELLDHPTESNAINPGQYLSFTFTPTFDPTDPPAVIELNFVYKEEDIIVAQLQVNQKSTGIWHTFNLNATSTNKQVLNVNLDLSDALTNPEDLSSIEVRFFASRLAGGQASVEFISLHLAQLIGEATILDVSRSFEAVNAAPVWKRGNTGSGIGIAILDSGVKRYQELEKDTLGYKTGLKNGWNAIDRKNDGKHDQNGHGTLVASIISNQKQGSQGKYYGVAPDSVIIPIQVLDKYGKGSYSQVIDGIQWVIDHKNEYNIRVMNLSLSAPVRSHYWDDPLNQAVMKAWQAGIVVVVAAGNNGPDPMSIGVPGNNPYVITVGALTDAYTPTNLSDDYVPSFSAAGPTHEGFVKPDLVAPGGHVVGLMSDKCELAKEHPNNKIDKDYYNLTGTSMSAAQVSGVVALMLAQNPVLTPDQVKYRLLASALPAITPDGKPAFSVWQQGTGRVNAYKAVYGNLIGTANQGLDINADLSGTQHFVGFTQWDSDTNQFYLTDPNGQPIGEGYAWGGGVAWSESYTWGGGVAWSEAYTLGGGVAWSEAYMWGGGVAWSEAYTLGGGVAWSETYAWGGGVAWSEATASLVNWAKDE